MERNEELINFIRKWFEAVLNIKLSSIDDLRNGQFYLEVINKCEHINIPSLQYERYEALENIMNKFYKMNTNAIVEFEVFAYDDPVSYEDTLILCTLIFAMCQAHQKSPSTLIESEYRILYLLIQPIKSYFDSIEHENEKKSVLDRESILNVLKKVSEKDWDDLSFNSLLQKSSITDTPKNFNDIHINDDKQSDDDMDNSLNVQSVTSQTSYSRFPNKDFVSDEANDSKESIKHSRRSKGWQLSRFNSQVNVPVYRKNNSPKVTECRKQESRLKKIFVDNQHYKAVAHDFQKQLLESESEKTTLKNDIKKSELEMRKLKDEIDMLITHLNDNDLKLGKKDKEVEKLSNQIKKIKSETSEKNDEIKQLTNINKELQSKIRCLNDQLQLNADDIAVLSNTEIENCKINQNLKNENERLKTQVDEYYNELQDKILKNKPLKRNEYVESPIPDTVEEGESMNFITEFKCAEMQDKFSREAEAYENVIKTLKDELYNRNKNSNEIESEFKNLKEKYNAALLEITENSMKLSDTKKLLKETQEKTIIPSRNLKEVGFKGIIEMLEELLSNRDLALGEKKLIIKHVSSILRVEYNDSDRTEAEIDSLYKSLNDLKSSNERKVRENESLQNQCDDLSNQIEIISGELNSEKDKNEELTRHYQIQKTKSDDTQFKLKFTLGKVQEEKNDLNKKYCELKREFMKSNDGFNSLRVAYDQSLLSLKTITQDCHDYEEVIKEITEREKKIYRNTSCQTDICDNCTSIRTNDMSPRTPSYLSRNPSSRRMTQNSQYIPEVMNLRHSPQMVLNNNIINNKSLHSLRNISHDNLIYNRDAIINNKHHKTDNKVDSPVYHRKYYSPPRKYDDTNLYCKPNYDRDSPMQLLDKRGSEKKIVREKSKTKVDSPLVKADRLQQIWSRNNKQPEHMKSSYPVETQGIDNGYVASVYMQSLNIPMDDCDLSERDKVFTARSNRSTRFTTADPLNLRSDLKNRAMFQCNDNGMIDDLLKNNNNHRGILSARSTNTQRQESFKAPFIPQLKLVSHTAANIGNSARISDRENAKPTVSQHNDYEDDRSSITSYSTSFSIPNSPNARSRRVPKGYSKMNKPK